MRMGVHRRVVCRDDIGDTPASASAAMSNPHDSQRFAGVAVVRLVFGMAHLPVRCCGLDGTYVIGGMAC